MPFVAGAAEASPPIRTIPPHRSQCSREGALSRKSPGFEGPRHVLPRVSVQAARDWPPAFTGGARSGSSPPPPACAGAARRPARLDDVTARAVHHPGQGPLHPVLREEPTRSAAPEVPSIDEPPPLRHRTFIRARHERRGVVHRLFPACGKRSAPFSPPPPPAFDEPTTTEARSPLGLKRTEIRLARTGGWG